VRLGEPSWAQARRQRWTDPRGHLRHGAFAARVRELARDADVVHLDELDGAPLARRLDRPCVVQLHWVARRDRRPAPLWTAAGRERLEIVRAERRAWGASPWMAAHSEEVAADLRRAAPRAEVVVARLALDPAAYPAATPADAPIAGLIGTGGWPPTADAVRRAIGDVWPTVRREVADAQLLIAGRGMTPEQTGAPAEAPGVRWVGEVPSATGFLGSLACVLYPLGSGSGAKVKALEAMALGVPVVTTADGAEGLAPSDGVIVEREPDRLAAAAVELLRDPAARRERGAAGRAAFLAHHAPEPATAPLVDLYRRMLA
jgi:glycosyltransferase involved in cell wall biosynthesis